MEASEGGEPPRAGKVQRVCEQWLVHEDYGLAYELQSQEFRQHYGQNRETRRTVSDDIRVARREQTTEEEEATRALIEEQLQLLEREEEDERVAWALQEELAREEEGRRRAIEDNDAALARRLQDDERRRRHLADENEARTLRRRARREQLRADLERVAGGDDPDEPIARPDEACVAVDEPIVRLRDADELSELLDRVDVSSPPADTGPLSFEERDAMFARQLQERERRRASRRRQHEDDDFEMARALQEKEVQKARRRTERRAQERAAGEAAHDDPPDDRAAPDRSEPHAVDAPREPHHAEPVREPSGNASPRLSSAAALVDAPSGGAHASPEATLKTGQVNIAAAIDPTFRRSMETAERQRVAPPVPPPNSGVSATQADDASDQQARNAGAAPYMPMSGSRRPGSLERGGAQYPDNQKQRDSCKQQ